MFDVIADLRTIQLYPLMFITPAGEEISLVVERVILAGYAGRYREDVEAHTKEMRIQGVPVPAELPVLYRALPCLLTQSSIVNVVGSDTQPEVEFVLFSWKGCWHVTVGNDQYDLVLERHGWAERSKNLCQKMIADIAWPMSEVSAHWDKLVLELWSSDKLLQQGSLEKLLEPDKLIYLSNTRQGFDMENCLLFSGTIATLDRSESGSTEFCMKLLDSTLGREIVSSFKLVDITNPQG